MRDILRENAERRVADAIILERAAAVLRRRSSHQGVIVWRLTALARHLRTAAGWDEAVRRD
jgi:hypothetical protein